MEESSEWIDFLCFEVETEENAAFYWNEDITDEHLREFVVQRLTEIRFNRENIMKRSLGKYRWRKSFILLENDFEENW